MTWVTSFLFHLLCPRWVLAGRSPSHYTHCMDRSTTPFPKLKELLAMSRPWLGQNFSQKLVSAWTSWRNSSLWACSVEFCFSLFWQEESPSLLPINFPPSMARHSLGCAVQHHLGTETFFLTFLWLVFRLMGGEMVECRGAEVKRNKGRAGKRLFRSWDNERWDHLATSPLEWMITMCG